MFLSLFNHIQKNTDRKQLVADWLHLPPNGCRGR